MAKIDKAALFHDLRQKILLMELEPEQDIDEAQLAERYALSRTPVREVLQRLAGSGYVEIRNNQGARVSPMTHATLRNFFLVAPMVYSAISQLAVQNAKPAQIDELVETQCRFRAASLAQDATALVIWNNRFHEIIGEMAGSAYLQPSLERLLIDHSRIGHTFFRPTNNAMRERLVLAVAQHDQFIEAIRDRDEDGIVRLVVAHWELSRENMTIFITPSELMVERLGHG